MEQCQETKTKADHIENNAAVVAESPRLHRQNTFRGSFNIFHGSFHRCYSFHGCFHGSGESFHGSFHELPRKMQEVQETAAAPTPDWTSQLVIPLLETRSECTAQPQQQQQQPFETEGQGMVVDAGKNIMELRAREQGWLGLVVQLDLKPYPSCSMGAAATESIDVWARAGIGTMWLVAMEYAGCGRHAHPDGEPSTPLAPD